MIRVDALAKRNGGEEELRVEHVRVNARQTFSVMGGTAAQRSLFLRILSGNERPDEGTVFINGTDLFSLSDAEFAAFKKRCIHCVRYEHGALGALGPVGYVRARTLLDGAGVAVKPVRDIFSLLGMETRLHRPLVTLQEWERRLAAFACAIAGPQGLILAEEPAIILADDPAQGMGESQAVPFMRSILNAVRFFGKTIAFTTQNGALAGLAEAGISLG